MDIRLFETAAITTYATRRDWDAAAVDILSAVLARWDLEAGEPFAGGYAGSVLRVVCRDGTPAVLKIGFPHEEGRAEAVALAAYPRGTAPRILRQDPWAWAMLMERIEPGIRLADAGLGTTDGLRLAGTLLARIASPGHLDAVPRLGDVVRGYSARARERRPEQAAGLDRLDRWDAAAGTGGPDVVTLVDLALAELDELADGFPTSGDRPDSLVHGDYNPGNILLARAGAGAGGARSRDSSVEAGRWAAIDPKPMIGDLAYDLWPLVSQLGSPFERKDPAAVLPESIAVAAHAAGCDPVRAMRWAFGRSGLNVTWYLAEGDEERARQDVAELRIWASLLQAAR